MKQAPMFPPLLKGHRVVEGKDPFSQAHAMLKKGKLHAGDILWSEDRNRMRFALVLEPEVDRRRCGEILYLAMVAFGDAAGAISAPEIAITYRWPNRILVNEAIVGQAGLQLSGEDDANGFPRWLIVGMDIALNPGRVSIDPGLDAERTTMWDEGCGDISRTELLESVSRHIVNWIHTWSEDGFKPVHDQWIGRISGKLKIEPQMTESDFVGLDEHGNALIKTDVGIQSLETLDHAKNELSVSS